MCSLMDFTESILIFIDYFLDDKKLYNLENIFSKILANIGRVETGLYFSSSSYLSYL